MNYVTVFTCAYKAESLVNGLFGNNILNSFSCFTSSSSSSRGDMVDISTSFSLSSSGGVSCNFFGVALSNFFNVLSSNSSYQSS